MPLKVTVEDRGEGVHTVRPQGSIDANTFSTLGLEVEEILKKSPRMIIFNMADVNCKQRRCWLTPSGA